MFESVVVSSRRSRLRPQALVVAAGFHGALALGALTASVWAVDDLVPPESRAIFYTTVPPIPVDFPPPSSGGERRRNTTPTSHPPKTDPGPRQPEKVAEVAALPHNDPVIPTDLSDAVTDPGPVGDTTGVADGPGPGRNGVGTGSKDGIPDGDPGPYPSTAVDVVPAATADCRDPVYPALAKAMRIQGPVVLEAVVATDGSVRDIVKLSGNDLLAKAASDALAHCRFTPARLRGRPVMARLSWTVNFQLK